MVKSLSIIIIERPIARVSLTKGKWALIDADDVLLIQNHKWAYDGEIGARAGYAVSRNRPGAGLRMHRVILPPDPGMLVDHINGDTLDNRRSNLRQATARQNMWNRIPRHIRDLPLGVSRMPGDRYAARANNELIGVFASPDDAHTAYRLFRAARCGEFLPNGYKPSNAPAASIGQLAWMARARAGMTVRELGDILNVGLWRIGKLERDRPCGLAKSTIERLFRVLGVPEHELAPFWPHAFEALEQAA